MANWLRRLRGALGVGLGWAVGWALGGIAIGVASRLLPFLPWDVLFEVFDAPLPALAVPGFVGGVCFALVLGTAARGRRLEELSVGRFALWGALGGLLLSLVPAALVGLGLATISEGGRGVGLLVALTAPAFMLLGAGSAALTFVLARRAPKPDADTLTDTRQAAMLDAPMPWRSGAPRPGEPERAAGDQAGGGAVQR